MPLPYRLRSAGPYGWGDFPHTPRLAPRRSSSHGLPLPHWTGVVSAATTTQAPLRELNPAALGDHLDRLYRAAVGLCGSHADAEDLVQETYLQVLRKPRLLRSDDDLGYLLRVLRNTFYSRYRSEARRPRPTELTEHEEMAEQRPGQTPEAILASREVLSAVAELAEPYREADRGRRPGRSQLQGGREGPGYA